MKYLYKKPYIYLILVAALVACANKKKQENIDSVPAYAITSSLKATSNGHNILFISIEGLNNYVGAMGGPALTPNIDKLAAEGRLFANAYTISPKPGPASVALMTGRRPEKTGYFRGDRDFRLRSRNKEILTIPQYLQTKGYVTIAAGKVFKEARGAGKDPNPFSDPISWNEQNTVKEEPVYTSFLDEKGQAKWLEGLLYKADQEPSKISQIGFWGASSESKEEMTDWKNASYASKYLSKKQQAPFFLAVGIEKPNAPQVVPQEFFDLYPLESIILPELAENDLEDVPLAGQENLPTTFVSNLKNKDQYQKAYQAYLASVSFADACVGKILEGLKNGPNAKNTIVVLYSKYGYQLGDKENWGAESLWKQATQVPLIIKTPAMSGSGKVANATVSLLDIFPTITDLIGETKPDFIDGESLLPQLSNANATREKPAVITLDRGSYSVQDGRYNYIRYINRAVEIYDHKTDPKEIKNLVFDPNYTDEKAMLDKWLTNL